ncbi:MAG: response regulator [Oscillospiraceae bacterium]
MYKVAIVEDDPMVAMINRGFLESDCRFEVIKEFRDGKTALNWLTINPIDLIVLDVFMPNYTGLDLLRELRIRNAFADVIMVTAANDSKIVDTLLKLGVTDYLVKPFTHQRFQKALDNYCHYREAIESRKNVSQKDLDALFAAGIPTASEGVPKGLQEHTLERIRRCLDDSPTDGCTSAELSEVSGLSAVTVRRYMNYLAERGEVVNRINYDTGGRPSMVYYKADQA